MKTKIALGAIAFCLAVLPFGCVQADKIKTANILCKKDFASQSRRVAVTGIEEVFTLVAKEKLPDGFVYVKDYIPTAQEDIRYSTGFNFTGRPIAGYSGARAIMTREAALALKKAADFFAKKGLYLHIYDAYRPNRAVQDFVSWSKTDEASMKSYFYPKLAKSNLFPVYIATRSGHSRGSVIDLTLADKDGKILDMGGYFDDFSEVSATYNVKGKQLENRLLLREGMLNSGFSPYDEEWWHFTLNNEPYPNTYFEFDIPAFDYVNKDSGSQATETRTRDLLERFATNPKVKQLIVVKAYNTSMADVILYVKENGKWYHEFTCSGNVGKNGIDKEREGDLKTPRGVYNLKGAFGIKDNPNVKLPYVLVNNNHYLCKDETYYNQLIDIKEKPHICTGECLAGYKYGFFFDFNKENSYGKGSSIFMHSLGSNMSTAGSIAVSEENMLRFLKNVEQGAKIAIFLKGE